MLMFLTFLTKRRKWENLQTGIFVKIVVQPYPSLMEGTNSSLMEGTKLFTWMKLVQSGLVFLRCTACPPSGPTNVATKIDYLLASLDPLAKTMRGTSK